MSERWGGYSLCGCPVHISAVLSCLTLGHIGMGRIVTLAFKQKSDVCGMSFEGVIVQVIHFCAVNWTMYKGWLTTSVILAQLEENHAYANAQYRELLDIPKNTVLFSYLAYILVIFSACYIQITRPFAESDGLISVCLKTFCCFPCYMAQQLSFLETALIEESDEFITAPVIDTTMNQ